MKIPAISDTLYRQSYIENNEVFNTKIYSQNPSVSIGHSFYYPMNINFRGEAELEALKKLFRHGLPCMYTGVEMLDSKTAINFLNSLPKITSKEVFDFLSKWEKSFLYPEFISNSAKEAYFIIKKQAEEMPEAPLKDVLQILRPQYEKDLIKQQLGIIKTLKSYSHSLPQDYIKDYNKLLENNENRILGKPIDLTFGVKEFQYKLEQIKKEYSTMRDMKSVFVINCLLKESKDFHTKSGTKNINNQRKTLIKLEGMLNRSHLNKDEALRNLFNDSKLRLNNKKTAVPFSKKAFLYDLNAIILDLPDKELKQAIITIATKLPVSGDSATPFIIKYSSKTPDKIIYNYLWPIIATIEHIWPKAIGGPKTELSNCGGACAKINSDRGSSFFTEQVKKRPMTPIYCQKYLNRLIKYALNGVFEKENVPIDYIEGYKNRIYERSNNTILLDTSKLYESGKFQKPEHTTTSS